MNTHPSNRVRSVIPSGPKSSMLSYSVRIREPENEKGHGGVFRPPCPGYSYSFDSPFVSVLSCPSLEAPTRKASPVRVYVQNASPFATSPEAWKLLTRQLVESLSCADIRAIGEVRLISPRARASLRSAPHRLVLLLLLFQSTIPKALYGLLC